MSSKRLSLVHGRQRRANPLQRVKDSARLSFADVVQLLSLDNLDYTLEDNTLWVSAVLSVGGKPSDFEAAFYIQAAEGNSSEELDKIYDEQGVDAFYEAASVGSYGIQVYDSVQHPSRISYSASLPYTTESSLLSFWHVFGALVYGKYEDVSSLDAKCKRLGLLSDADEAVASVEAPQADKVEDASGYTPTPTEQLLSDILLTSPSAEVVNLIAAFQAKHGGGRTLRDANGRELMAFAGTNSDPDTMSQYSYRQHAWQKIGDSIEDTSLLSLRTILERVIRAVSNPDRRAYAAAARILLYLQQRGYTDARIVDEGATPVVIDCGTAQLSVFNTDGDGLVSVRSGNQQKYFDLYSVASWMEYLSQFLAKQEEVQVSDSAIAESDYIFPASSKDVKDGRSHFPIQDIAHGRNAIARVNQYKALPKWYSGKLTLEKFVKHVVSAVKKRYPKIEVSKEAMTPQPAQVSDSAPVTGDIVFQAVSKFQPGSLMTHGNIGSPSRTVEELEDGSFRVMIMNRGNSVQEGLKQAAASLGMEVRKDPEANDFMSTTVIFAPVQGQVITDSVDDDDDDDDDATLDCTVSVSYARKFADMLHDRRYSYEAQESNHFVISPSSRIPQSELKDTLLADMEASGIPAEEVDFE